jgi:hypothetical protein
MPSPTLVFVSLSLMPNEEKALRKRAPSISPCKWGLYLPRVLRRVTNISFSTEALRTHPRRSERVLEVCSPSILKRMSSLVPYPYILWTTLASQVCK